MDDPKSYEKFNGSTRRDVNDFSEEFSDEIAEISGRCLDIGSGPGDTVVDFVLPKMHPTATLVCSDISESMVNYGNDKYKNNHRLSFIELDIESPDLSEDLIEQFDHVTSFYCLHWCQDLGQAFENIYNLLRPGGNAFLVFIANFPGWNAYKELAAMPRYQPYMKDADRYIPVFQNEERPVRTLKTLLKCSGFEIVHCSIRERNHTFKTVDLMGKLILSFNPFINRMPADITEEYTKDLIKEVMKHNIMFKTNDNSNDEYSALMRATAFTVHLRRPFANSCENSK